MRIRLHPTLSGEKHDTTDTIPTRESAGMKTGARLDLFWEKFAPILLLLSGDFPSLGDGCVQSVEHLDGRLSGTTG